MADHTNINRIWADLLIDELVRAGVGLFCLAPGSRSTPLTTAVAAHPEADHLVHFDERGTAFCALGYARATRRPAAWITTSGTAVANGLPAVVEASVDGVPMLLLTADRPPELRDSGANQTIDQVKLFEGHVRWQFDLPVPDAAIDPAMILTTADQAVYRTRRMPAGPVHLNAMFREPLAPDPDGGHYDDYLTGLGRWMASRRPYTLYRGAPAVPGDGELRALRARIGQAQRGLIVAGRLETPAQADAVRWLADALGWPLLPDVCSQLRMGGEVLPDHHVPFYDLMLASDAFRERHQPDVVLYFGGRATSKRLNGFLGEVTPESFIVVRERPERMDPHHRATDHVESDIVAFCGQLAASSTRADSDSGWSRSWTTASERVAGVVADQLSHDLTEPAAARLLAKRAPSGSGLLLASSMPVRDADTFASVGESMPFVTANRGASGIDGTIATAVGLARGLRREVTLLIGDLAALHDLNSLSLVSTSPYPVVVVIVNNHGGGIFSFLPIARHEEVFETYFGTPHAYGFEHAARQFNLPYEAVTMQADLERAYTAALRTEQSTVIELITSRDENVRLHQKLQAAAVEALD